PNPCVRCNQFVRFDGLIRLADDLGVDYVATGHYARVRYDRENGRYDLLKGVDPQKDQSYMLHTLTQAHLARILFPLGDLTKPETRQIARDLSLPVAEKPDSVELCFVAGGNYRQFLQERVPEAVRAGDVVDRDGNVLGRHDGISGFTVGQRKGLGIPAPDPRFVIELRPRENQVVVGSRADAAATGLTCSQLAFTDEPPENPFACAVKIRYRSPERAASITVDGDRAHVQFAEPVWGVAPGQFAVFYDDDRVIGGGAIEAARRD
ncbi:MAG TPA: tRNA 2-thiouridine(34) synthase MnmA, partial [Chloroflexota bacterium]|nr:tRNA 2-thiouridine(34) synthase MnmA [Chloroflexota bacterium]